MKLPAVEDRATVLVVNEIFGPTVQGEGPSTGQLAMFVRLYGCSLSCQWCDTAWTWDSARFDITGEQHPMTVDAVLQQLRGQIPGLVVVTGGEPLLQQDGLATLGEGITSAGIAGRIEVETSGTVPPWPTVTAAVTAFNVSPKLAHSGLRRPQRIRPEVLRQFAATGKAVFKFVARDLEDLNEIDGIVTGCGLAPVWVMPEGRDSATVLARMRALADPVIARGWNLTPRLHVLLWEDQRAR